MLQLESLEIHCTDEAGALEKTREETCPGNPFITFSAKPTVQVVLENPIPRTGLFTITSNISNGDTTQSFTNKIAKIVGLKGKHSQKNKFSENKMALKRSNLLTIFIYFRCRCAPSLAI